MEIKVYDNSKVMLTTERLRLETWRTDDLDLLYDLHADPRVQAAYAPGPYKWTTDGIKKRLAEYMAEQQNYGFTKWKLCLPDGTFIGRAGWSPWGRNELEIGYAIKPDFWNNGYASEAAIALLSWAQAHHPQQTLVGFALPNNGASLRVLEKLGMTFVDRRVIAGAEFAYYEVKN
jgi:[ribosomal protein S5]-alanine N-acetyltransferase